uniref:Uncharacterized protein n=1 Tax=Romanomermis culicivorax TaxID=13658 RepID=A0A915IP12_ROMCU
MPSKEEASHSRVYKFYSNQHPKRSITTDDEADLNIFVSHTTKRISVKTYQKCRKSYSNITERTIFDISNDSSPPLTKVGAPRKNKNRGTK